MDDEKEKEADMPHVQDKKSKMEGVEDDKASTTEGGLLAGWTSEDRRKSQRHLMNATSINVGSVPTPFEEKVFGAVGDTLASILRYVLKRWHKAMKMTLDRHSLKPVKVEQQLQLIAQYLRWYHQEHEATYGTMEKQNASEPSAKGTVTIRSTGYAAEVFLGVIMADRVWVLNQRRKDLCKTEGFVPIEPSSLTDDSKYCTICCDELGVANPEGDIENPVRVVICCHQVFGENCLKIWLKENWKTFDRDTCPNCRFKFPETFLEKLLGKDWKRMRDGKDDDGEDSEDEEDEDQGSQSEENDQSGSGESSEEGAESATSEEQTPVAEARPTTPQTTEQFVSIVIVEEGLPFAEPLSAEVDTPMGNTQEVEGTQSEVSEAVQEAITIALPAEVQVVASIEREDVFMLEG